MKTTSGSKKALGRLWTVARFRAATEDAVERRPREDPSFARLQEDVLQTHVAQSFGQADRIHHRLGLLPRVEDHCREEQIPRGRDGAGAGGRRSVGSPVLLDRASFARSRVGCPSRMGGTDGCCEAEGHIPSRAVRGAPHAPLQVVPGLQNHAGPDQVAGVGSPPSPGVPVGNLRGLTSTTASKTLRRAR